MPRRVHYGVIAGGSGPANGFVPMGSKWTTRKCDLRNCNQHENLTKCSQCRTALYCSKECQRADWKRHKIYCQMTTRFPPAADPDTGGEPQVQRHLRLWTSRFNDSLMCAIIVALDLHKHPENLDKFGLVVTLRPRVHPEAGSRFSLISAEIGTLSGLMEIVVERQLLQARGADVRPNVAELHQQHRDQQKRATGGTEDYAAVMIIVQNGEDDRMDIRFKPVCIYKHLVRSLASHNIDWYASLEYQVNHDVPSQERVR
ncbi:hypothetical protein B0H14DRAFT_3870232 [Mycena olivaceomarginata]|nr:hypothetical protein B0H14DRAFT_3870232 [Mycena olivaceomarginata]